MKKSLHISIITIASKNTINPKCGEFRNCVGAAYAEHHLLDKDFEEVVEKCRKKYNVHMTKAQLEELLPRGGGHYKLPTKRLEHRFEKKKERQKSTRLLEKRG